MKAKKNRPIRLPIGRAAVLAFQISALRHECCKAAELMVRQQRLDEAELEDCALLDDSLAAAHDILKAAVSRIALERLRRRSEGV